MALPERESSEKNGDDESQLPESGISIYVNWMFVILSALTGGVLWTLPAAIATQSPSVIVALISLLGISVLPWTLAVKLIEWQTLVKQVTYHSKHDSRKQAAVVARNLVYERYRNCSMIPRLLPKPSTSDPQLEDES